MGIRALEMNFNPKDKTYNPHWHLIVPDRETAITIIVEWQRKWTKKYTRPFAQHKRKVGNLLEDMIEVLKYGSKIFTDPEMKGRGKSKIPPMIYAAALDNIFKVFENRKLFGRFGFTLPKTGPIQKAKSTIIEDFEEAVFDIAANDWVIESRGELITGYVLNAQLDTLLDNAIDTQLI